MSEAAVVNLSNPGATTGKNGCLGNNARSRPCKINDLQTPMSNMS